MLEKKLLTPGEKAEFDARYGGHEDESFGARQALSYLVVIGTAFAGRAVIDGRKSVCKMMAKVIAKCNR